MKKVYIVLPFQHIGGRTHFSDLEGATSVAERLTADRGEEMVVVQVVVRTAFSVQALPCEDEEVACD